MTKTIIIPQRYENFSIYPNIFLFIFQYFLTFSVNYFQYLFTRLIRFCTRLIRARIRLIMGGYQPGNKGLLGWLAEVCEVVVAEVLAVGWQLVVLSLDQMTLFKQKPAYLLV